MMREVLILLNKGWQAAAAVFGSWNVLDYIIGAVAIVCVLLGAIRGFKFVALSLFGYLVSFVVAARFHADLVPWVRKRLFATNGRGDGTGSNVMDGGTALGASASLMDTVHDIVAFLLLFAFVLAGLWLIRLVLKKFTDVRPIRTVDRITGAVLGLVQFIFLWCMIYVFLRAWPPGVFRGWVKSSVWVDRTGKWIPDVMVEAVKWAQWL